MSEIKLIDSTLRDGMHLVENKFSLEDVRSITKALNKIKVDYIEIGYGYGLGYLDKLGYPKDIDLVKKVIKYSDYSKCAVLIFPNKMDINDLDKYLDLDIGLYRIAIQADDTKSGEKFIKKLKDNNKNVGAFLMMASRVSREKLEEESKKLIDYGVDSITITDSAGAMTPKEVKEKISSVKKLNTKIGFHTHDNLGLAIGNSLLALENEALMIDLSISGFGAGAGNTSLQEMIACLLKEGYKVDYNLEESLKAGDILEKIASKYKVKINNKKYPTLIGYTGIYSAFLNQVKNLSKKYKLNSLDLMKEIAKESLTPGDEERIDEIAKNLRKK